MPRVLTRGRAFIPEVDGLRFVAIAAVVLYHLRDFTPGHEVVVGSLDSLVSKLLSVGNYGVELFFVLSGFLLAMPFAKWRTGLGPKPSLRTYYLRRLTRLEPPYLLAMLILFITGLAAHIFFTGGSKWPSVFDWPNLLASLIYQHNIIFGTASKVTPVAWSLEIEVQFYLLAPLLSLPFSIRRTNVRRFIFLTFILALPILRGFFSLHLGQRFNTLPWYLEFFVAGFLLADLFLIDWNENPRRSFAWDTASLIGWPVLIGLLVSHKFALFIAPAILLCYAGAFRGKYSSGVLSRPQITLVGGMCYSIYLLHYTVIMAIGTFTRKLALHTDFVTRFAFDALIILPVVLTASVAFFIFVERPCMDPTWPSRIAQRSGMRRLLGFRSPAVMSEVD
jgi:peptidoglycan/LPS O-acetylase OafA/YrhL